MLDQLDILNLDVEAKPKGLQDFPPPAPKGPPPVRFRAHLSTGHHGHSVGAFAHLRPDLAEGRQAREPFSGPGIAKRSNMGVLVFRGPPKMVVVLWHSFKTNPKGGP